MYLMLEAISFLLRSCWQWSVCFLSLVGARWMWMFRCLLTGNIGLHLSPCVVACSPPTTQAAEQPFEEEDQVRSTVPRACPRGEMLPQGLLCLLSPCETHRLLLQPPSFSRARAVFA